jgi:hypothetical protein
LGWPKVSWCELGLYVCVGLKALVGVGGEC